MWMVRTLHSVEMTKGCDPMRPSLINHGTKHTKHRFLVIVRSPEEPDCPKWHGMGEEDSFPSLPRRTINAQSPLHVIVQ